MKLPRFLEVEGYDLVDFKEYLSDGKIEIHLELKADIIPKCYRCGTELGVIRGKHRIKLRSLPILHYKTTYHLFRNKRHCPKCKKARSEEVSFMCDQSPHLTKDYSYWLGRMFEFSPVSRVAKLMEEDAYTLWRLDLNRMKQMLQSYVIPKPKKICVDEVHARSRHQSKEDRKYFTIITDLETRKVIWVAEGREKASLDQFFVIIGEEASSKIEVVVTDMHDAYRASQRQYAPQAKLIYDKFHVLQYFELAVNETRDELHKSTMKQSETYRLTRGRFKFMFLKKARDRTDEEHIHMDAVMSLNEDFIKLELIKERMLSIYYEKNKANGRAVFEEIGRWIWQAQFKPLMKWYEQMEVRWSIIENYYEHRVTNALAEGINHVIKTIKRKAYGYRNMEYFKLKILQVCGYLNSQFIPNL